MVFLIILLAIIVVLVVANIKIVPQAHAYVIERLGARTAQPGALVFILKFRLLSE